MSSPSPTQPRWILSFADLLSVVLSFLVLSYSMQLPPKADATALEKNGGNVFSLSKENANDNIRIAAPDNDLDTNYLYKITQKRIGNDSELSAKLKLRTDGDSLSITVNTNDFPALAPKLAQLLKVIQNNIRIYSASIDTSRHAYEALKDRGFDQDVMFMEKNMTVSQLEIVIHP